MNGQSPECFEVYITRKGPVLVSGSNRVDILRSVTGRTMQDGKAVELCYVTADTKLPKSSIFSTLEDLVKKGILRYGTVSGKKGYELDSYRILGTMEPQERYDNFSKRFTSKELMGYDLYRMNFDYLVAASLAYGLDISPIMKTLGNDFGKYILKQSGDADKALKALIEWYDKVDAADVTVTSRLPVTIEISFRSDSLTDELAKVFSMFVLYSVSAALNGGRGTAIESTEIDGSKVTGRFGHSDSVRDFDLIPSDFEYDEDADADFMIYITSFGTFRSVDSRLGMAILDVMPSGVPMSSADITKALKPEDKKPQSSVLFYLEKMIAAGIVEDVRVMNKRKFVKRGGDLYNWSRDPDLSKMYLPDDYCRNSFENPSTAYGHILSALIKRLINLRIVMESAIGRLARSLAQQYCDMSEKKTIESIMNTVMDKGRWLNLSVTSITSFVPFTFVRKLGPETDEILLRTQVLFDTEFFRTVIREITGVEYASECTPYTSGDNRGYKLTFNFKSR